MDRGARRAQERLSAEPTMRPRAWRRGNPLPLVNVDWDGAPGRGLVVPEAPGDGLESETWRSLEELILIASASQPAAYLAGCRRWGRVLSLEQMRTAGLYLAFLLRGGATLALRHSPTAQEIGELGRSVHPEVSVLLNIDEDQVVRTLLSAYDLAPAGQEIVRGDFLVLGPAVLGAILKNAKADLDKLRRPLANWCSLHEEELRDIIANS